MNDKPTLLYLVNQGTITSWLSRVHDLDRPDFVLFDIDPHQPTFPDAVKVARELHCAKGKHAVPPYVVRPTPLATVSMPIAWEQLTARLNPGSYTINTVSRWFKRQDPFAPLAR